MTKYCNDAEIVDRDENGARGIFLRALLDGALILSGEIVMLTINMLQSCA